MTTDLSSASVPPLYRDIYNKCSNDGEPIPKDIFQFLLSQYKLSPSQRKAIWDLTGPKDGFVNRTNFYKTLALVAWAQQGKEISEKLFDTFTGNEYPSPENIDLAPVENLVCHNHAKDSSFSNGFNYTAIVQMDTVNVQLVPEKKGLFLKYSEYLVSSKRFNSRVTRRYNDFVALQELLLNRFPYRLVPSLPPKKMLMSDDIHFLEERRRGLHRWLTLVCRHPVMCHDALVSFFLTDQASDFQHRVRNIYKRAPDEFMTSDIAATAKDLLPSDHGQIAANREHIRSLVNIVARLKQLTEESAERQNSSGRDLEELATQLKSISAMNIGESQHFVENWGEMQRNFSVVSKELQSVSLRSQRHGELELMTVCENVALLLDILVAHKELCERLEKGLAHDHQVALSKMLSLKKRKIQGVIRGSDTESVEQLEGKMLAQENVISNIELRTDFSLYCVHMETQLVYAYLGTMSSIINSFIELKIKSGSELLDLWKKLHSKYVEQYRSNGVAVPH